MPADPRITPEALKPFLENVPAPGAAYQLSGVPEDDPHIYRKTGGKKVIVRIDPRWITATTAHDNLKSGNGRFAGFGIVMEVGDATVHVSPLVIGKLVPPGAEWFYG